MCPTVKSPAKLRGPLLGHTPSHDVPHPPCAPPLPHPTAPARPSYAPPPVPPRPLPGEGNRDEDQEHDDDEQEEEEEEEHEEEEEDEAESADKFPPDGKVGRDQQSTQGSCFRLSWSIWDKSMENEFGGSVVGVGLGLGSTSIFLDKS